MAENEGGAAAGNEGTETKATETKIEAESKTFTQDELDAKVEERLRRERQKFGDYDALKAKATEYDQVKESQKDEHEKALDQARKDAKAEAEAEFTKERFGDRVLVHAAKDFADPEDAVLRLKDRFSEFVKNGQLDDDAIKAELKSLLKTKPHLSAASKEKQANGNGSADGGARTAAALDENSSAADRMRSHYSTSK